MTPRVSVIVPVYNASRTVAECLASIRAQSYAALDIVCVNDGSHDDSLEILRRHAEADDRVTVIHQENQGVSAARNTGLEAASGELVVFVDSDDTISPEHVSALVDARKGADLVIEGAPSERRFTTVEDRRELLWHGLRTSLLNPPWGKIYRREIIDTVGIRFARDVSLGEDLLFNIEYITHARDVCTITGRRYVNRIFEGSLTRSYRPTKYAELSAVHRRLRGLLGAEAEALESLLSFLRIKSLLSCARNEMSNESGNSDAAARTIVKQMQSDNPGLRVREGDLQMRAIGAAYHILGLYRLARLVARARRRR